MSQADKTDYIPPTTAACIEVLRGFAESSPEASRLVEWYDRAAAAAPPLVYCGCIGDVGHFVWRPARLRLRKDRSLSGVGPWKHLDTKDLHPPGRQGDALLTWRDGWTALGIVDNTVDTRGGSHSTFAVQGSYDFEQMLALARRDFPAVARRLGEVRLVATAGVDSESYQDPPRV